MSDPRSYEELVAEAEADPRVLVRVERTGAIATVTLDDPAKYNVLSAPLTVQLRRRIAELVVGKLFTPFTPAEYAAWAGSLAARVVDVARAPASPHELTPAATLARLPLSQLMEGVPAGRSVTFQRVRLARGVAITTVSAEPVAEYGLALRARGGPEVVIPGGYSDTVFGYLPSGHMLGQHGYEDEGFLEAFGLGGGGARFRPGVEQVAQQAWERVLAE